MDCVGCEKCRLWGKLQVLGLGTALKILFSDDGQENLVQTVSKFVSVGFFPLFGCFFYSYATLNQTATGLTFKFILLPFQSYRVSFLFFSFQNIAFACRFITA
jgi:hypothetical protein